MKEVESSLLNIVEPPEENEAFLRAMWVSEIELMEWKKFMDEINSQPKQSRIINYV